MHNVQVVQSLRIVLRQFLADAILRPNQVDLVPPGARGHHGPANIRPRAIICTKSVYGDAHRLPPEFAAF